MICFSKQIAVYDLIFEFSHLDVEKNNFEDAEKTVREDSRALILFQANDVIHQHSSLLPISRQLRQSLTCSQELESIPERIRRISIHSIHCSLSVGPEHTNESILSQLTG